MSNDQNKSKDQLIIELQDARESIIQLVERIYRFSPNLPQLSKHSDCLIKDCAVHAKNIPDDNINVMYDSESWFRNIVDILPQLISYTDKELVYRFVNKAYENFFDTSKDNIVGRKLPDVIGKMAFEKTKDYVYRVLSGETVHYQENLHYTGERISNMEAILIPDISSSGEVSGYYAVLHDLTYLNQMESAIRESERKYRNFFKNAPLGLFRSTNKGHFIEVNPAFAHMFGYNNPEQLVQETHSIVDKFYVNPKDRCRFLYELLKTSDTMHYQHRFLRKNGSDFFANLYVNIVREEQGEDLYLEGIVEDITEQKQAEEALKSSYKQLELREKIAQIFLTSTKEVIFQEVLDLLLQEFNATYGHFGHIDDYGHFVCPSASQHIWTPQQVQEKMLLFLKENWNDLWGKSLTEKCTILYNRDLNTHESQVSVKYMLIVPLLVKDTLVGQIAIANDQVEFSVKDKHRLENFAKFISPILQIFLEKEKSNNELSSYAAKLEEMNTALKVLLENREEEKNGIADSILKNFEKLVFPYFEKIKESKKYDEMQTFLQILETNTEKILSSLNKHTPSAYRNFTPMEIQIADLIKAGKTSKEIAKYLDISIRSVYFHRNNIRSKLNIRNSKINLRSYLFSL